MSGHAFTSEDVDWIQQYTSAIDDAFRSVFQEEQDRFRNWETPMRRCSRAVSNLLSRDWTAFRAVDEAHNELCIAAALIRNTDPVFVSIEYEPSFQDCGKSIDFRAVSEGGCTIYIDVKTIRPESKDRWKQFERAKAEGWFPERVNVILQQDWMGGEIWHNMFAARSRMLEYTIELENKISYSNLPPDNTGFILAFCGEGFHWHEDELEDFVAFYRTGRHRSDDPFGKVEEKYIKEKNVTLQRCIGRFCCMRRERGELEPKRLNWNVLAH